MVHFRHHKAYIMLIFGVKMSPWHLRIWTCHSKIIHHSISKLLDISKVKKAAVSKVNNTTWERHPNVTNRNRSGLLSVSILVFGHITNIYWFCNLDVVLYEMRALLFSYYHHKNTFMYTSSSSSLYLLRSHLLCNNRKY